MPLLARQVREMLQHASVHPHVIKILEALAEDNLELRAQMSAMTELMDRQSDIMMQFTHGAGKFLESAQDLAQKRRLPANVDGISVGSVPVAREDD